MKKLYILFIIAVFFSDTYSQIWNEQTMPAPVKPLWGISVVNSNYIWICGNQNTVLSTSNGGANWVFRGGNLPVSGNVYSIAALDSVTVVCAINNATNGYIFRTTNNGTNWTQIVNLPSGFIDAVKFQSATSGFGYADRLNGLWKFYRTTNGGATFDTNLSQLGQIGGETGNPNALYLNGSTIMFGTNISTRVYKSTNGSLSWISTSLSGMTSINAISFRSDTSSTGFAVGTTCYYTTNSGSAWTLMNSLPGTGTFYTIANLGNKFWYSRGTQIFYSSNSGINFIAQPTTTASYMQLNFLSLAKDNILTTVKGWGVTNNGLIGGYSDPPVSVIIINNEIPDGFNLYQNYPNPFNPETTIRFNVPYASNVIIKIFDIRGREVTRLLDDKLQMGSYNVKWDGSHYPSGIYFYHLAINSEKMETVNILQTRKMILIK